MKIHIVGASCAGSTTLGQALSAAHNIPYFDTDAYFWEVSEMPYTIKRDPELRNNMLKQDLEQHERYIVGGSLVSWGAEWKTMFDLVVFLHVPQKIRLERLIKREEERYGGQLYTNPERKQLFEAFIAWASRYEDPDFTGRNIKIHNDWLNELSCPVLKIEGDTTVEERLSKIKAAILSR